MPTTLFSDYHHQQSSSPPPPQQEQQQEQQHREPDLRPPLPSSFPPAYSSTTATATATAPFISPPAAVHLHHQSDTSATITNPRRRPLSPDSDSVSNHPLPSPLVTVTRTPPPPPPPAGRRSFAALAREKTSSALASLSPSSTAVRSSFSPSPSVFNLPKQHQLQNQLQNQHSHRPSQVSVADIASVTPSTSPLSNGSANNNTNVNPDPFSDVGHSSSPSSSSSSRPTTPASDYYSSFNLPEKRRPIPTTTKPCHIPHRSQNLSSESLLRQQQQQQHQSGLVSGNSSRKMHQTSSKLLRMTEDERPFTKDFMDLFSTLMVSLKLESHRIRFTKYDHSFTAEEAISNLGSLKFSQSNRMPDPKDPSRIVTTTTTTTFSMAKEMARSVCQRFVDARFIEAIDSKSLSWFPLKGALFQLTPKGINILQRFCQRNGITARHILDVLDSPRNTMQLVNLERDAETDKLSHDRATVEVIFRRFAGYDGPNVKTSISSSDSDSLSEYANGLVGVRMARDRKVNDRVCQNTFTGKAAIDWLMDCSTTIERRETCLIAELFVKYGLITMVQDDRSYQPPETTMTVFQPTKNAIYSITDRGQRVCGWIAREKPRDVALAQDSRGIPRDSNNARLSHILQDPALRLLFREFLRYSLCEENLSFYLDVSEFTSSYHKADKVGAFIKVDAIRENLAAAYGLYNAFLAPGSPCELNIDHALRNSLAGRMTKAVGDDESMYRSLQEVVELFEMAQTSVFKLMSSDSVPKFMRDPKYAVVLQEHDVDIGTGRSYSPTSATTRPERAMSRSVKG